MVMNTKDTYFGGPLHSDLTVDGIVYNYISSNHHGDQTVSGYALSVEHELTYRSQTLPTALTELLDL